MNVDIQDLLQLLTSAKTVNESQKQLMGPTREMQPVCRRNGFDITGVHEFVSMQFPAKDSGLTRVRFRCLATARPILSRESLHLYAGCLITI
jgi:hypothetical protein